MYASELDAVGVLVAGCSPIVGSVLMANKSFSMHSPGSIIYSVSRLVKNIVLYADLRYMPARMYTAVNFTTINDMVDNRNLEPHKTLHSYGYRQMYLYVCCG